MLKNKRLKAFVTALIIGMKLAPAAYADVSAEDLAQIQLLLQAGNYAALREFLSGNPELLAGDSPLSRALVEFNDATVDLADLSVDVPDVTVVAALSEVVSQPEIY